MFEFHGWASLKVHDYDDTDQRILEQHLRELVEDVTSRIRELDGPSCSARVGRTAQGLHFLDVHGATEARFDPAIAFFQWLSHRSSDSFGLLYVRDEEDHRPPNPSNCFRVFRLARGSLDEHGDQLLSPCIPTIEAPFRGFI